MIPLYVIKRAIQRFESQTEWPLSPGLISDAGEHIYCAAAALAYEGLADRFGSDEAKSRLHVVLKEGRLAPLIDCFIELGWPANVGEDIRERNDAQPENSARRHTLALYKNLANGKTRHLKDKAVAVQNKICQSDKR